MLSMKTKKQNKGYQIEKVRTLTPELKILLLLYLSIPRDKPRIFSLLGHEHAYGYTLPAPSRLGGFMLCLRYRYTSRFGGVVDMPELQVHVIVWWSF